VANILVVEDSMTHAKFIESALSGLGHDLAFAADGEEAASKLAVEDYDAVILDVVMPKKNGFELCREIRNSTRHKTVPIILISSKNLNADRIWGIRQGADEYITKPFEPERLIESVNRHITRKSIPPAEGRESKGGQFLAEQVFQPA
jgi:twitching motility two-component system response regulator PilH